MKLNTAVKVKMVSTLALILLLLAAAGGWIANIVKLMPLLDGGITGWMIARIVGIFMPPLGAILGFL